MKLVLVTHTAYPDFIGGREQHVHNLASALSDTDEVVVVAGGKVGRAERTKMNGYTLVRLPMVSITVSRNPLQVYRIIPRLFAVLELEKPDLVHAFEYGSHSTDVAYLFAKKRGLPFVLSVYGYKLANPILRAFKKMYDRFFGKALLRYAQAVLCPSPAQCGEMRAMLSATVVSQKVMAQENCIRVSDYDVRPSAAGLSEECGPRTGVSLLTVTRILPRKGLRYLVLAMDKAIREHHLNIKLMVVGPDCGELDNLRELIAQLALEKSIVFAGAVPHVQVKDFLGRCDIFVLPSLYEGSPLALFEAMAAGKPVIFTDLAGMPDIVIDGQTALLAKPADVDSLTEAIVRMARDEELRAYLGKNAKNKSKLFDVRAEAGKLRRLYGKILGIPSDADGPCHGAKGTGPSGLRQAEKCAL